MIQYEAHILIHRSVGDVFEYLITSENIPQWAERVVEASQITPGPVGVGTRIREVVKQPFGKNEVHWEITTYEANSKCTYVSESSIADAKVTFTLTPVENGTRLATHATGRGKGFFRLLEPFLNKIGLRDREVNLATIKAILES